jgi:NAD(P)-dependent dehydrogenase (short-subunit alcohol dehydrogenase family)
VLKQVHPGNNMTESILVTGSNRGIGLEIVRQYAEAGWRVYACCRSSASADELKKVQAAYEQVSIHDLDVTDGKRIQSLAEELNGTAIDVLFNNAGVYGQSDAWFGNTDVDKWVDCFRVNTIAPLKLMEALVENVAASRHKLMATMSSKMGSMADNGSGGSYVYRSSKAAVNAVMKSASIDLRPRGIKVAILHPGWVLTDMGGPNAEIGVEECVTLLRRNLDIVTLANSGTFFEIDGTVIPW